MIMKKAATLLCRKMASLRFIVIIDLITFLTICLVANLRQSQIVRWDEIQPGERNLSLPLRSRVVS